MARFERSTLPEHKYTRNIVLRFLKIITPVECVIPSYGGYINCPREGELYQKFTLDGRQRVWNVNIDEMAKGEGLKLLWDK